MVIGLTLGWTVIPVSADEIDFSTQIRPILSKNCYFCHGPDSQNREADLRLDTYEGATESAIDPGDLANSEFLYRLTAEDEDERMPPPDSHKSLTAEEIDLLTRWVKAGAPYEKHWAFVPPGEREIPETDASKKWAKSPIDHFIHARLSRAGLAPSREATPQQLIRRLSFDLNGLPPTPGDVARFVAAYQKSPDQAVEELVDRLLASEHFGERMTLAWMDAARYGDTSVMHADGNREMWRWRDWVMDAYHHNKPFSDFLREQLAGDLVPNATFEQKVATGFNRNNATSDEGGAFPEELRVEYTIDRVATTSNVFLGLSVECAQCHDHKYDPISQKEYYGLFAFFNNAADPGMQTRKGNEKPLVEFVVGGDQERAAEIDRQIKEVTARLDTHAKQIADSTNRWTETADTDEIAIAEPPGLTHHFALDLKEGDNSLEDLVTGSKSEPFSEEPPEPFNRFGTPAVRFTGKDPVVVKGPNQPHLDVGQPFAVSYWIRTENETTSGAIAARINRLQKFRGWDVWLENDRPGIHLVDTWPTAAIKVVTSQPLTESRWNHVVITYDGKRKARGVSIFVNGKKVPTTTAKDTLKPGSKNTPTTNLHLSSRLNRESLITVGLDDLRFYDRVLASHEISQLDNRELTLALNAPPGKRTPKQTETLTRYYLRNVDPEGRDLHEQLTQLNADRAAAMKGSRNYSSMIMGDLPPDKMRMTYVLNRGQYDSPKKEEVIRPDVPAVFPRLPEGSPASRLGLADWFLREDHPLTARVAVNRYWALLFGSGIVSTVTDFGNQGSPPTHQALLDWMALDFRKNGWDIKRTIRQIVTSATYRQSSAVDLRLLARDPQNLLLARAPRFRLQGEFIRDAALSVSGLLVDRKGGPGTRPYQPPGLWKEVALANKAEFQQDHGDALYRKSIYIYWKRSAPHPAMTIFDAPSREKCVVQRQRTNTPLQALVTLNDVQFVEASRKLAGRALSQEGAGTFETRIAFLYRLCTSRDPEAHEIEVCRTVFDRQLRTFRGEPQRARAYLAHGESPLTPGLDPVEHAAWTVIANMILNLDETLTRG